MSIVAQMEEDTYNRKGYVETNVKIKPKRVRVKKWINHCDFQTIGAETVGTKGNELFPDENM